MSIKTKIKGRRKILFINPAFQGKFISNMLLFNVGICLVFYSAQNYFFWKVTKIGSSMGLSPDHIFFRFIKEQQHAMTLTFITTAILVSLIASIFGIVYSHKIAGPLYHLNKYLRGKAVGESKYTLKFRKGDYFQELAEATNVCLGQEDKKNSSTL